ncbi:MAG: AIPR family protein [Bacteroides sp.]|nr:AIPR family protein [Bacteroides sp.]MCM1378731.1 AIPR family protein [Bacteroides sp.]MCM1445348.1 AIPR family protein [Prevotella sp.]
MPVEDRFEHFVNFSLLSNHLKNITITNDLLDEIKVGAGGDWGLDGIIILINGKPITRLEQAQNILSEFSEFKVKIILTQAKTQTTADTGDLAKTLNGAENLLRFALEVDCTLPPCNESVKEYAEIIREIYRNSANFANGTFPEMHIYFSYQGDYHNNQDFNSLIELHDHRIKNYQCLSALSCTILDKRTIVDRYRAGQEKSNVKISFEHKIPLPVVPEIDSSYLCLIPMSEFRKLIIDDSSNFREEVFYDNVRAFQGNNSVNSAIDATIKNGDISLFTSMNNGITIIAKEVSTVMKDMSIHDYQIVNGCQTCHVIFNNIDKEGIDNLQLCVKIIASKNKDIRDRIIVANNSQTAVVREQLLSLLEEQRRIEDYYNAQQKYQRLYYERRSKQYHQDKNIKSSQIVSIGMQITSFISMILGKPSKIRGYYGQVLENFSQDGIRVFDPNNNPALYYLSAFAYVRMSQLFVNGTLPKSYKKIKFHVLYTFRLLSQKFPLKNYSDKKVDEFCDHICAILNSPDKCKEAFLGSIALIHDQVLHRDPIDSDRNSAALTRDIKQVVAQLVQINKTK